MLVDPGRGRYGHKWDALRTLQGQTCTLTIAVQPGGGVGHRAFHTEEEPRQGDLVLYTRGGDGGLESRER